MPVRVVPSNHPGRFVEGKSFADDAYEVFESASRSIDPLSGDFPEAKLLQSSFDDDRLPGAMIFTRNGFVGSIVEAYNEHRHLQFRPEDVWFAILSQFNQYMTAHAEELREHFVDRNDRKELNIKYEGGDRYSVDFAHFAVEMTQLIEENILDKDFRDWIIPDFTTTMPQDRVIASIVMMSCLQTYFGYSCTVMCGIPSVTLLGTKEDYQKILTKLDNLLDYGDEAQHFVSLLRPVIGRIIQTFDDPEDADVLDFWQKVVHVRNNASGPTWYSGWVTAFCFWDPKGKCLFKEPERVELVDDNFYFIGAEEYIGAALHTNDYYSAGGIWENPEKLTFDHDIELRESRLVPTIWVTDYGDLDRNQSEEIAGGGVVGNRDHNLSEINNRDGQIIPQRHSSSEILSTSSISATGKHSRRPSEWEDLALVLDGVEYHRVDSKDVSPGSVRVPVLINDNKEIVKAVLIAGSLGISCTFSGNEDASGFIGLDTIQPVTGWCIYERSEKAQAKSLDLSTKSLNAWELYDAIKSYFSPCDDDRS